MTDQELAAIEARQKAATPSGRVIFESEIIEKDVPKLIAALREALESDAESLKLYRAARDRADAAHLRAQELRDALHNMIGLFGEAATRLTMGKAYTELHAEAVKIGKETLKRQSDTVCMCGHQGPDRQGEHVGAEIPAPSRRLACTHAGCNCKGFGTLEDSVNFLMDERLGGP